MVRTLLFYSFMHGDYLQDPRLKLQRLINEVEQMIFLRHKRLLFNSILARLWYHAPGDMKSTHSGRKIQMSNIPRLPQDEGVFHTDSSESGSKVLFGLEQRNIL